MFIDFQEFYVLLYTYSLDQAKTASCDQIAVLGWIRFLVLSIYSRVGNRGGEGVLESTEGGKS